MYLCYGIIVDIYVCVRLHKLIMIFAFSSCQTSELTTLRTQLSEQAFHHERQLRKNETEHEVILDDLDRLNEQYQQLQEAFGTQSKCLKEAQCETQRLQEDLTEKDTELARIHLQQREKRESLTRVTFNVRACENKLYIVNCYCNCKVAVYM